MNGKPLNFDEREVQATLSGGMTQIRRPCHAANKWALAKVDGPFNCPAAGPFVFGEEYGIVRFPSPFGRPGQKLWIREEFALSVVDPDGGSVEDDPENWDVIYRADPQTGGGWTDRDGHAIDAPWRRAIHMPRWASRIQIEITSLRVEQLSKISELDAVACSTLGRHCTVAGNNYEADPIGHYLSTWGSGKSGNGIGWEDQWVWALDFKVLSRPA